MTRDLNDTLVFIHVVQTGSFTAAARAMEIPNTTVSRRVRELETHLGAALLHRTTRKLRLTEAGAAYFGRCSGLARQLDDAENAVQQIRGTPGGWLRVTLPYSFGATWIAPLIAGFCARYPEVRVDIVATHVPLDLIDENVDVALRLGVPVDSSLVARRLGSFSTSVYASPVYIDKHGAPERPGDLHRHSALALHQARSDSGYTWPLRKVGRKARRYALDPVIVASDPVLLLDAARAGNGVLLAMDASMASEVAAGHLRKVLPEWIGPQQDLNALYPREGGIAQATSVRGLPEGAIAFYVRNLIDRSVGCTDVEWLIAGVNSRHMNYSSRVAPHGRLLAAESSRKDLPLFMSAGAVHHAVPTLIFTIASFHRLVKIATNGRQPT